MDEYRTDEGGTLVHNPRGCCFSWDWHDDYGDCRHLTTTDLASPNPQPRTGWGVSLPDDDDFERWALFDTVRESVKRLRAKGLEPENFMVPKTSERPRAGRNWLERRYELFDSTLVSFRLCLERDRGGWFDVYFGYDTDMKYRTVRFPINSAQQKQHIYAGLKRICDTVIPPLVDKIDHDRINAAGFAKKVSAELIRLKDSMP